VGEWQPDADEWPTEPERTSGQILARLLTIAIIVAAFALVVFLVVAIARLEPAD